MPTPQNLSNPFNNGAGKNIAMIAAPQQRTDVAEKTEIKIEIENGGVFHHNLSKYSINRESLTGKFNLWFGLGDKYSFQQTSERTDELGFTHVNYQQLYNGIVIDGCVIMAHFKNGIANSINGQISQKENIPTQQAISSERAYTIAKEHLKVSELLNEYPVELLVAAIPSENGFDYKLAYKIRIDAANPFTMCYVFVDAQTGSVINKINLIAHADTPGTAVTLYSGTQNITCDSYSGSYRLRENGRKIETYNATNTTNFAQGDFVTGTTDYTINSTTWQAAPRLNSFTISSVSSSWWYTAFADEEPDLYIKIKNGSNQTVYTSGYFNNTFPPVTFSNLNIYLTSPPYTVEVWDYDAVGGDDFGGSYTINTSTGTFTWSGNGNTGSYNILASGHPALDVHWGMEKTYDFYLNVFGRNSYDGNGSVIKNYISPPLTSAQVNNWPNNAFAMQAPYNIMVYGMGDGSLMNPVVGLDVEGHEYSHLVINHNGNGGLTYQAESGALNESFADIFGTCIEFYSNVNPDWTIGEGLMIPAPFMRSMSNPKSSSLMFSYQGNSVDMRQPNTYQGQFWKSTTNLSDDNGGVHMNSGVQNFWFYLLSQGGSGTNDLGNSYSVTGIGINQARQIAYRNLTTYLGSNSNYLAAYNGSLQAAEDLYGNPSTQYNAVRAAWYAVGIGTNPNTYCSGTTFLTANSGTVTDGSGSANYNNNSNCKWIIAPPGATQININFTYFNLENGYDTVFLYTGTDTTGTPITFTGTSLPPSLQTIAGIGACLIKFKTDASVTAGGWSFNYTTTGTTPTCSGLTTLSTPTGSFTDGSGSSNYGNNQNCFWYIAPPCATSVTLSFSQFNTELNYDGIIVYDDIYGTNVLAVYSGTSLPASVTSNTGTMLVRFISNYINTAQGFTANYTSTGSAYCSGTTTLNSSDWGTFTDGSGASNYCNNTDCRWLIQPPQATSVTLTFNSFDLELPNGQTIYDAVEVYNGPTTGSPLLGRFSGNNLPPSLSTTGGSMLVRFYSDLQTTAQGWSANYTSTSNPYCNGQTTLTAPSGSFSDGSGTNQYANNSQCSWLIQPPNATSITLSFVAFSTEQNNDGVIVYDGVNNSAPILGQFSGSNLPNSVTSTGGSMFVEFISGTTVRGDGWTANYTSTIPPSAPVANFSATSTSFCESTCINFTDNSTNLPTSWSWSFPGGNPSSSTAQNPSNICYNTAGTYNVVLTSSNSGGSNTKTINGYITVNPQPTTPNVTANPSNVVCQGQTVTLSVSNPCLGCNYNWSLNGQTGTSIPVTSPNSYSVTASNTCGQVVSSAVNVTVNPLPPTPTITVNGSNLTSSSATGNQWYLNSSQIPNAVSQTYTVQQSGGYYVVVTDGNNCSSQSAPVSINAPVANFSATSTSFCESTCISFTDNSTNSPTSWNWSFPGGNPSSSTAQNPSNICYNTAGTYNVILTASNVAGGNTKTTNGYITVNPQPTTPSVTANPSNVVCQGQTVTLSVSNPCSGCNYNWSPNGQTGTSIPVTSPNSYSATASNSCGQVVSSAVNVTVNPLPPTPTITINGSDLTSSSATGNQWYLNGSQIGGATQQIFIAQQSGNYHVVVTDGNDCSSQSASVSITITGIDDALLKENLKIFPNPTDGVFTISSGFENAVTLQILDMLGKQTLKIYNINKGTNQIDASELSKGVYLIKFTIGDSLYIERLVIN